MRRIRPLGATPSCPPGPLLAQLVEGATCAAAIPASAKAPATSPKARPDLSAAKSATVMGLQECYSHPLVAGGHQATPPVSPLHRRPVRRGGRDSILSHA